MLQAQKGRLISGNVISFYIEHCETQRAEARCYPKKKVPKKTLQIQKI